MRTLISHRLLPFNVPRISLCHWLEVLLRWQQLHRERHLLAQMSDHRLRDMGISRAEAKAEARRPFWEDPRRGSYRY